MAPEVVESVDGGGVDGAASGAATVVGAEVDGVDGVVVVAAQTAVKRGWFPPRATESVGAVGVVVDGGLGASLVAGRWGRGGRLRAVLRGSHGDAGKQRSDCEPG